MDEAGSRRELFGSNNDHSNHRNNRDGPFGIAKHLAAFLVKLRYGFRANFLLSSVPVLVSRDVLALEASRCAIFSSIAYCQILVISSTAKACNPWPILAVTT